MFSKKEGIDMSTDIRPGIDRVVVINHDELEGCVCCVKDLDKDFVIVNTIQEPWKSYKVLRKYVKLQ